MSASSRDLTLALALADVADLITIRHYRAEDLVVETKPDLTPVTEADRAVEQALRDRLSAERPPDAVLGEEYGASTALDSTRRWIIDPIDGTMNYVRGMPVWATLLALEEDGQITVGVVSAPALHRRWWASLGGGAFVDEGLGGPARRLRVSAVRELADAQLCLSGFEEWQPRDRLQALLDLGSHCWRTRGYGDFWSYMLVAEGAVEIGLDPVGALWDLAASQLIVEEAGGRFTDLAGRPTADGGDGIATNSLLHDAALAFVRR